MSDASKRLRQNKENILTDWLVKVLADIPAAKNQSEIQLRDHVPKFLDRLSEILDPDFKKPDSLEKINDTSQEHGEQRARLKGYSLFQIIKEYHFLRECILDVLERETPISYKERNLILTAIEQGMAEASHYYVKFVGREDAASKVVINGIRDHAIIKTDSEGVVQDWNLGAELILGWKKEEIIGKHASIIFVPEDLAKRIDTIEMTTARETGKAEDKRWHIKKDKTRFFANGIMNSLIDEAGAVYGYVKVLRDDTERLKIENDLDKARYDLTEMFMQNPIGMALLTGPEHKFILTNPNYIEMFGRDPVGKTVRESFTDEEAGHFIKMLDDVYKNGTPFVGREVPYKEDRCLDVYYYPYKELDGTVTGILAYVLDVTDTIHARRRVEASLQELRIEKEIREKFVATLTHDLRTPLTAAKIGAQVLGRKFPSVQKVVESTQRISNNLDRVDRMIRDLLDVSVITAGHKLSLILEKINLNTLITEVSEELSMIYGDRFIVNGSDDIEGNWDKEGLQRIFENLLSNAIKYGEKYTPVTITLADSDKNISVAIHNSGTPISEENISRLFEQFNRADSIKNGAEKGWGLGLTLVKGLVEAHGGKVSVKSNLKDGTIFKVTIPKND